jgi:hypothetical protein
MIVSENGEPIASEVETGSQITVLYCCNANGEKFKPLIILNNLQSFPPELATLRSLAHFASQLNRWMTKTYS